MIENKGWESFCEAPEAVSLSIMAEFYANAKTDKNGFSVVRGMIVDYHLDAIRRVIGQKPRPRNAENWVYKKRETVDLNEIVDELCVLGIVWKCKAGTGELISFPAAAMNRYTRAWNLFLCANILPSSHSHEVTVDRAIFLYGILTENYIDLGYVIHHSMLCFLKGSTTGAIPHATIVTKLFRVVGVLGQRMRSCRCPVLLLTTPRLKGCPSGMVECPMARGSVISMTIWWEAILSRHLECHQLQQDLLSQWSVRDSVIRSIGDRLGVWMRCMTSTTALLRI